jgi:hypothetical protein
MLTKARADEIARVIAEDPATPGVTARPGAA